jgi:Family of unknown function (DUF6049)
MPRPLLTGCAAMAIAGLAMTLAGLAVPVSAATAAAAAPNAAPPVSLAITSVSPAYARPGETVTVSGTLTNSSSKAMSGLSIQLRSSGTPFSSRGSLQEYADGTFPADEPVTGAARTLKTPLAARTTINWSVPLTVNDVGMSTFGVYPLAAEAENSSLSALTVSRTFLPFWPKNKSLQPDTEAISWIWPLIDQPRQGVCPGLLNNGLNSSLASGGRLNDLLQVGSEYSGVAHLTWAIDPALLANVDTMTKPYTTGNGGCGGSASSAKPASQDAESWLAQVKSATAGQPVFLTPYADADVAALTRSHMTADLARAFTQGRATATSLLDRNFTGPGATGSTNLTRLAWPADGIANHAVLKNLAANGIAAVVLDSSTMPASPQQDYTPSAQATASDGTGTPMTVLLSDGTITQIIGTANATSDSKATAFAVEQRYLAETAMIAAEQPSIGRSVVVAPPRRWDPPAGLASALLSETVTAPWLRSVSLGDLAAVKDPSGKVPRQPPRAHSKSQVSRGLLGQARHVDQQAGLLASVEQNPSSLLKNAAAAIESAAWRGGGSAAQQGAALARQISGYLARQSGRLTVFVVSRVTLGGLKGTVPVSISNGLNYAVNVKLQADPSGGITVRGPPHVVTVPPGQQVIVKISVAATTVGSTVLRLRLLTPQGVPFSAAATVTIQATHYGTLALVIMAAALGVLVLTAVTRGLRRRGAGRGGGRGARQDGGGGGPGGGEPQDAGPQPQHGGRPEPQDAAGRPDWPNEPEEADNVVADGFTADHADDGAGRHGSGHASDQAGHQASGHDAAEGTDDYAWAPGRADRR